MFRLLKGSPQPANGPTPGSILARNTGLRATLTGVVNLSTTGIVNTHGPAGVNDAGRRACTPFFFNISD